MKHTKLIGFIMLVLGFALIVVGVKYILLPIEIMAVSEKGQHSSIAMSLLISGGISMLLSFIILINNKIK